jgi:hypothetical protein
MEFHEVITKMRTEQSGYSTAEMCLTLGVIRSGLYDHTRKDQRDRRQKDAALAEQIFLMPGTCQREARAADHAKKPKVNPCDAGANCSEGNCRTGESFLSSSISQL